MDFRFWRRRAQADVSLGAMAQADQHRKTPEGKAPEEGGGAYERFDALDRAMQAQITLLDERSRLMAEAMTQELRALSHIIGDLAQSMAVINAKLDGRIESPQRPNPSEREASREMAKAAVAPPIPSASPQDEDALKPPQPANDAPLPKRAIDPLLLDALAKGRVAFEAIKITAIPPRTSLLALMRFAPPLPEIDSATLDRLAELFPDAALLLDRFIMDAAASMLKSQQIPHDLPLVIPLSPASARDVGLAADFRRRFERLPAHCAVIPLFSEMGWISLAESGAEHRTLLNFSGSGFAIRTAGDNRIDHIAISQLGARYIFAPAAVLAATEHHGLAPDIHPTDVVRLFSRAGIGLVAEDVPDQVTALGLLRNNISMGWGPALQMEPPAGSDATTEAVQTGDYRSYLRRAGS